MKQTNGFLCWRKGKLCV